MIEELDQKRSTMTVEQVKTLEILKSAGSAGITSVELIEKVWNYKGRIHELIHKFGAVIKSERVPGKRYYRYTFIRMKTCEEIRAEYENRWRPFGRFEILCERRELCEDSLSLSA